MKNLDLPVKRDKLSKLSFISDDEEEIPRKKFSKNPDISESSETKAIEEIKMNYNKKMEF